MMSKYGYVTIFVLFFVWLSFFDNNNLLKKWKIRDENKSLASKNQMTEANIKRYEETIRLFSTGNVEDIEKFARENFLMKAPDEDVFLFDE
jgi:cell division protein FtsB